MSVITIVVPAFKALTIHTFIFIFAVLASHVGNLLSPSKRAPSPPSPPQTINQRRCKRHKMGGEEKESNK
jgi:hypothetical protein